MKADNESGGLQGVARLVAIVARLRGADGCPWDRKQTIASLRTYLIEESYELLDAMESGDSQWHKEELGDVLLQIALQARIREEEGAFALDAVADSLCDKLVRRHPHVFGSAVADTPEDVVRHWEAVKSDERRDRGHSIFESVARHLPALQKAQRVQSRAAKVGFDWPDVTGARAKLSEELDELNAALVSADPAAIAEELGDVLFSVVNVSRFCKVDAEEALRTTIGKFIGRFEEVERRILAAGGRMGECSLEEMDRHWEAVKRDGR